MKSGFEVINCGIHETSDCIRVSNYEDTNTVVNMGMTKEDFEVTYLPQFDLGIWTNLKLK